MSSKKRKCALGLRFALSALGLVAVLTKPAAAQTPRYNFTDLGTFANGGDSHGFAINASGQVTGYVNFPNVGNSAFRTTATGLISDPGTNLGPVNLPPNPLVTAQGYAINASGQVAGIAAGANGNLFAFRTSPTGLVTDPGSALGTIQGSGNAAAYGINDRGQATGFSYVLSNPHAVRTSPQGIYSDPGADIGVFPIGSVSIGYAINASGQVTGDADTGNNVFVHAFRTSATGLVSDPGTDLGLLPGSLDSYGYAINDSGQVAGYADYGGSIFHAFRTSATGLVSDPGTDLGVLSVGTKSIAQGINNAGWVVGVADSGFRPDRPDLIVGNHAILYTDHLMDLNDLLIADPGWTLLDAYGINASGQITGVAQRDGSLVQHAFRLTQVNDTPEPGALALLVGLGTSGAIFLLRRRISPGAQESEG
jgi:probable HAF family extracellular repeat protein